jgi:ferredoxin-thioredoxin reductase catalytic chain
MTSLQPNQQEIDSLYQRLYKEAEQSGYHLNPDVNFTGELVKGLLVNEKRHGYWACPCRLADGERPMDRDIICPCDYRDPDLADYGCCFCRLYVSSAVMQGKAVAPAIPERRPDPVMRKKNSAHERPPGVFSSTVWRCRVCGYLCGREQPPDICPICKASKDRFEIFT